MTRHRPKNPVAPGVLIQEWLLDKYQLTQGQLADRLGVSRRAINELVRQRRAVSPEMALRLSRLSGETAEFWLKVQALNDLARAEEEIADQLAAIRPLDEPPKDQGRRKPTMS